jgi:competence ComEA-like helix-hairpin-helix protein
MKFSAIIAEYLTFNRKEQRGIFVLATVLFVLILANAFIPVVVPQKQFDFSGFGKEISAFEKDVLRADSLEERARKNQFKTYPGKPNADSSGHFKAYPKEKILIELNSADTFDLQRLHGIGSSFARRIVKYRERLGGFFDKSQLLEVWGMDTARYTEISASLTVNPDSIHRMDLNIVTFKELIAHPYFPFEMTKDILLYRKQHKKFTKVEELKNLKAITEPVYRKMVIYLKIAD